MAAKLRPNHSCTVKHCGTFIITKSGYASKAKNSDQLTGSFEFYLN